MHGVVSALVVLILALPGGCVSLSASNPELERRPSTLAFYGDPVRIDAPDTVVVGTPFQVTITSYGGGCVRQGETRVEVQELSATVRPYVYEPTDPNLPCQDILQLFEHQISLVFTETGTATIRVHGWKEPGREPLTVSRSLRVQPRVAI